MSVLYASGILTGSNSTDTDGTATSRFGAPSLSADAKYTCNWWTPDMGRNEDAECAAASLRRALGSDLQAAVEKASVCAQATGEPCILSHELNFPVPAAFLWDMASSKMRPFLLPQRDVQYEADVEKARVRVGDPLDSEVVASDPKASEYIFARKIKVSYIDAAGSLQQINTFLNETDAYCIQLLNVSIPEDCAVEFDM